MSKKVPLDVLIDSLLQESSQNLEETPGLKWEWEHYLKIEDLISKIREKEANRDVTDCELTSTTETDSSTGQTVTKGDERRTQSFPAFLEWLRQNNVDPDKVQISYVDQITGHGLKTKLPLKTGEIVFTIPRSTIITSCVARESKLKLLVEKDPLLSGMQNVLLAMFLVYEKYVNPDSPWKPYIDVLPHRFDTIMHFTKEEIMVLKNSTTAFREALRMYRNVARQYAYFHVKFRKATDSASRALKTIFTYNRYVWGVSAVTTRINHLPNPNGEPVLGLIPLWDLCNHEESELLCTDYNEENETLICYAGHDYEKDSEFTIFYGRRSSVDFLVHNGFVPQSYRHDFFNLELGIGMNDPNYNRKKAILGRIGLDCQSSFPVKPDTLSSCKKLYAFVRVFQADTALLGEIEEKQDNLTFLEEPTESCWKFLATRFLLLQRAAENALSATMKNLHGTNGTDKLSQITIILLQLLKNEQKVLEMLVHCTNGQVNKPIL